MKTNLRLLPIIIIVSLLGFFILLALTLLICHAIKNRQRLKRRRSSDSHRNPTKQLTIKSGKVIPVTDTQEILKTPSTLDPVSPNFPTTLLHRPGEYETEKEPTIIPLSRKDAIQEFRRLSNSADLEAQIPARKPSKESKRTPNSPPSWFKEAQTNSIPSSLRTERNGSLTLPRPLLINIERRGSEPQTQRPSNPKGPERADSVPSARRKSRIREEAHELPATPVPNTIPIPEAAVIVDTKRVSVRRMSSPRDDSIRHSQPKPGRTQTPLPEFSPINYGPHVRFAPLTDKSRMSFLSTTDSASSSSTAKQPAPTINAPPPSTADLSLETTPPPTPSELVESSGRGISRRRHRPPSIDVVIPTMGERSFIESPTWDEIVRTALHRVPSVMSSHSVATITSSDISADWTIGNAQLVNIYPSVSQESSTPPYARKLRSKYGRYPKGRRDKALPTVPKSPLSEVSSGG